MEGALERVIIVLQLLSQLIIPCQTLCRKELDIMLMSRAIGWEAPEWAASDRVYVASVIRYRMLTREKSVAGVLLEPHQFSVAELLVSDPQEDMSQLKALAVESLQWGMDDLPIVASHFYSPLYIDVPFWANDRCEVVVDDGVVHRYFLLPCQ